MKVTPGILLGFAALASLLAAPTCDDSEPPAGGGGSGAVGGDGGDPGSGGTGASAGEGDEPGGAPANGGSSGKGGAGTAGGDGEGGDGASGGTTPSTTGGSGGKGGSGASGGSSGSAGSGGVGAAGKGGTAGTAGTAGSASCEARGVDGEPAFWAASGSRIIAVYPNRDFDEVYADLRLSTTGLLFRYSPTAMHLAPGRELVTSFNGSWQKGTFEQQSDGTILMVDFGKASLQDYNAAWGGLPVMHAARGNEVETIDFSTNPALHLNYISFRPPTDCADVVAVLSFLSASVPGGEDTWTVVTRCGTPAEADYRVFDHLGLLGPRLELNGRHFRYGTRDEMGNHAYWFVGAMRTRATELWYQEAFARNLAICDNGRITPYEASSFTPGLR
jgi:hypothetical protein